MRRGFFLILVVLLASAAFAADVQPGKISLDLTAADINDALAKLSQQAQVSIVGDATVKGKVTCSLTGITLDQALDTICKMNKLVWVKVYLSTDPAAKQSPTDLFKLLDALKALGASTLICEDPKTQTQIIFVPGAKTGSVDTSTLASGLKLKAVYLLQAEPDPAAKTAAKDTGTATTKPSADPKVAASQVWNYFGQMPVEQRWQVMRELRDMFFQNMTPEQREQLFRQEHRDRPPMPDGAGPRRH